MDGFNYEIKIENSPFEIGNNSNILKVNMELPPTPKVADFNISFKDTSFYGMMKEWMDRISIDSDTVFDEVKVRMLTKRYPYKSKKKRLVKKWWNKHSEIRVYKNVKLEPSFGELWNT